MNYTDKENSVRVDFFKPSGKWYCTEAVVWTGGYETPSIHYAFRVSLRDHFKETPNRLSEMDAVCLEPYHKHSHPIQLKAGSWVEEPKDYDPTTS